MKKFVLFVSLVLSACTGLVAMQPVGQLEPCQQPFPYQVGVDMVAYTPLYLKSTFDHVVIRQERSVYRGVSWHPADVPARVTTEVVLTTAQALRCAVVWNDLELVRFVLRLARDEGKKLDILESLLLLSNRAMAYEKTVNELLAYDTALIGSATVIVTAVTAIERGFLHGLAVGGATGVATTAAAAALHGSFAWWLRARTERCVLALISSTAATVSDKVTALRVGDMLAPVLSEETQTRLVEFIKNAGAVSPSADPVRAVLSAAAVKARA